MTWTNRFRLFFGFLMVVIVVGALTVALSHRKGEVEASSAAIDAQSYAVGTDYSGAVLEQYVATGDLVREGDRIATIQSNDLVRDLNDDIVVTSSEVFEVNLDGTLTVNSAVTGVVTSVDVLKGAYAPAGSAVATIAAVDTLFVSAEFRLSPADFARIDEGADVEVTLPNGSQMTGVVGPVEAATEGGVAIATVDVLIDEEQFDAQGAFVSPGTPVTAVMDLRNEDALANFTSMVRTLIADVREALAL